MTRWLPDASLLGISLFALNLAGCAAPAPPPPPTVVNLTLTTSGDVNPTADNQGAPVAIRIYQLTSAANFNSAEFFPLYNADAATLKSDIVRREDFLMAPGQTKTETIKPDAPVKSVAVFAALRDFQHAMWRGSVDIEANKTTNVTVSAGHDGVTIKAIVAPPPPKPAS